MEKEAEQLVNALLASGKKEYQISFELKQKETFSDEKYIVPVLKTNSQGEKAIKEFTINIQKAVAGPKGNTCPVCGGTGRI